MGTEKDLLSLPLLELLTGSSATGSPSGQSVRAATAQQIRADVQRNLSDLFNATALSATHNLKDYPQVARSTLNFGLPALAGRTLSSLENRAVERMLTAAITQFEPRIVTSTLAIEAFTKSEETEQQALTFVIQAEVRVGPLQEYVRLLTRLDLDSGEATVVDAPAR